MANNRAEEVVSHREQEQRSKQVERVGVRCNSLYCVMFLSSGMRLIGVTCDKLFLLSNQLAFKGISTFELDFQMGNECPGDLPSLSN